MNIDYLNAFITVTELKSISLAAKQLHLSQSALSQQIQSLERLFQTQLFERSHRGVVLTTSGERVYEYAVMVLQATHQLESDLSQIKNQIKTIKILSTFIFHSYALPCSLYHLSQTYPHFNLDIKTLPSHMIEQQLANGLADIGLITGKPSNPELCFKKVYQDQYCLVASPELNMPDTIQLEDLYEYPMILLDTKQKSRQLLNQALKDHGLIIEQLKVPYLLDSAESIKISALQGYGIVFLPYMSIKKELYTKQLKAIEIIDFDYHVDYYAIKKQESHRYEQDTNEVIRSIEEILAKTLC